MSEPEIVSRLKERLTELHGLEFLSACPTYAAFCRQLELALDRKTLAHLRKGMNARHGYEFAGPCRNFEAFCHQLSDMLTKAHPAPAQMAGGIKTIPGLSVW